jgi:hypothetical protein
VLSVTSLLLAGVVAALPFAAAAPADTRDVLVTATAGFVDATAPPQPVPAQGDLPVAHSALGEQARAVVALDVPADATAATVTFRASGQPGSSYGSAAVSVCRVMSAWKPGAGQALAMAPTVDCTGSAPVKAAPWTFDLAHILRAWAAGAPVLGIALVDNVSAAPAELTFNIVGAEHVGTVTLATPSAPRPSPAPAPAPAPDPAPVVDPGFSSYPQLGGSVLTPRVPVAPVVPVPAQVAPSPVLQPTSATALPALPVDPRVWLLLPVGVAFLLALRRAVSAAADDLTGVVTA